ncbi:DUF4397 domain-containing protein [Paenibacillaceae bacterium]|nr:DUF4397 domain-containing protein [Paenibacillaceae bacterium]
MNWNDQTLQYWREASINAMLAQYYRHIDPDRSAMYAKQHSAMTAKLAAQVEHRSPHANYAGTYPPFPGKPAPEAPRHASYSPDPQSWIRMELSSSRVRMVHASPETDDIDIYANGKLVISRLNYKSAAPYLNVTEGHYVLDVYPSGAVRQPLVSQTLNVQAGNSYTIAAGGQQKEVRLYAYLDDPAPTPEQAKVKFVHLCPDAGAVDVRVSGGGEELSRMFEQVEFMQATSYAILAPSAISLHVNEADGEHTHLVINGIDAGPQTVTTVICMGGGREGQRMEALLLSDL